MTAKLKIVGTHRPVVIDLYAKWREEIEAVDWRRVHIQGGKNPPLDIPDAQKRGWRA